MKRLSQKFIVATILFLLIANRLFSQQEATSVNVPISLQQYLANVAKGNLGYVAGQFNVSIAEAGVKAAKVFPNPEISVNYSNNEDNKLMMGQGIETGISYPVSLGNKRGAGVALAKSQFELAQSTLEAYFQNLRADATLSYFAAMKEHQIFLLQEDTYKRMKELANADSIRLKTGAITEIDALQTALEAKAQLNQVFQSKAEMQNTGINLSQLQGKALHDTLYLTSGDFLRVKHNFVLSELIQTAVKNRAELQIAIKNREISEKTLRLLKANRAFEFRLEAGYSYNAIVRNEIAPAPAFNSYSTGISIPLKFSNFNKGELQAAKYAVNQNETLYRDVELQITAEVTQAYYLYLAKEKQIEQYEQGLVANAEKILHGRIYSYQRGESGLIEVLNAQRTYNDLRKNYYETLNDYSSALVELERSAAIWDIK